MRDYIEGINELYQLSDLYIFPTIDPIAAIEHPLSVMESNGLKSFYYYKSIWSPADIFTEKNGFHFVRFQ